MASDETRISISLPTAVYNHFAAAAVVKDKTVDEAIADHLERTRRFTSSKPFYFDDIEAGRLRTLLGPRAKDEASVLTTLERLVSLGLGGDVTARFSLNQQEILIERQKFKGIDMQDQDAVARGVSEDVAEAVAEFCRTR